MAGGAEILFYEKKDKAVDEWIFPPGGKVYFTVAEKVKRIVGWFYKASSSGANDKKKASYLHILW